MRPKSQPRVWQASLAPQLTGVRMQPWAGSQAWVVQASLMPQSMVVAPGAQDPLEQTSSVVQRLPVAQGEPSGAVPPMMATQLPLRQVPCTTQASWSVQAAPLTAPPQALWPPLAQAFAPASSSVI